MLATKAQIIDAAKALPDEDREDVIAELEATFLPEPPNGMTHEEFSAELERRWQAAEADPSTSLPWEQVIAQIRERYKSHG